MAPPLTKVCVRLHPDQVKLLDALVKKGIIKPPRRNPPHKIKPSNRSTLIRHALTAGLDVLTDQEPLQLLEP